MREGWEARRLGELCDIGSSKRVHKRDWAKSGVPFYRAREIVKLANQGFVDNDLFITEELFEENKSRTGVPKTGDLMVTAVGTLGISYIVQETDRFYFKDASVLWLQPKGEINSHFMHYAFQAPQIREQTTDSAGATVGTLTISRANSLAIELPSLPEQKRIVAILDEAFEGIAAAVANAEKNLANARELFESYLNSVFAEKGEGWAEKTLKEVSIAFGRGKSKHRPRNDPKLYGGSYRFIQTGDVRNCDHVIKSSTQTYNEMGLSQSKLWPKGTICITIAANIAETGILGFDACFPDSVIGVVVDEARTSNDYVEYLLQSVKARIKSKGKGSAQANINLATFENERFPFPLLDEQNQIVAELNKLSAETARLELINQQKLTAFGELKQSLLQKAFTGELTAQPEKELAEAVA